MVPAYVKITTVYQFLLRICIDGNAIQDSEIL